MQLQQILHGLSQSSRHASPGLIRLVLAWFALSLAVAVASPIVKPQNTELICTGSGVMKLIVMGDEAASPLVSLGMDCPQCLTPGAPPPSSSGLPTPSQRSLSHVLRPVAAAHIAALTAAPLPARGPPQSS